MIDSIYDDSSTKRMRFENERVFEDGEIVERKDYTLAREVPRMCLPSDHPYYTWSHERVYEVIASTTAPEPFPPFVVDTIDPFQIRTVWRTRGEDVHTDFPGVFPDVDIRPKAWYVIGCVPC